MKKQSLYAVEKFQCTTARVTILPAPRAIQNDVVTLNVDSFLGVYRK